MKEVKRVMVIGIDGATLSLLRPWADSGELPTIRKLVQAGSFGELCTTFPPITPSAWTSFMTGKITLAKGEAPKIIALASKSPALVDAFNKVDTEWPDNMSPQRLEEYKAQVKEFRERLGV